MQDSSAHLFKSTQLLSVFESHQMKMPPLCSWLSAQAHQIFIRPITDVSALPSTAVQSVMVLLMRRITLWSISKHFFFTIYRFIVKCRLKQTDPCFSYILCIWGFLCMYLYLSINYILCISTLCITVRRVLFGCFLDCCCIRWHS